MQTNSTYFIWAQPRVFGVGLFAPIPLAPGGRYPGFPLLSLAQKNTNRSNTSL